MRSGLGVVPRAPRGDSRRQRTNQQACAQVALNLLRGKWKLEILLLLMKGPVRLGQLRRLIPQATKKMLIQRLREMEREGIIVRTEFNGKVKHVEYTVSAPVGIAILNLLGLLMDWGNTAGVLTRFSAPAWDPPLPPAAPATTPPPASPAPIETQPRKTSGDRSAPRRTA